MSGAEVKGGVFDGMLVVAGVVSGQPWVVRHPLNNDSLCVYDWDGESWIYNEDDTRYINEQRTDEDLELLRDIVNVQV